MVLRALPALNETIEEGLRHMATKDIILTPEGRDELIRELAEREGVKNDEIIESLKEARSFGDLSENAEYDAAREEQSKNAARINEIRHILAVAKIVDAVEMERASEQGALPVSIGTTVTVEDERGKSTAFTIVGTTETDSLNRRISNESPAGAAMIGHVVGDRVSFTTPTGKVREYTITAITR